MNACAYILQCANGQYYTGSTHDINKRLAEHSSGIGANFTAKHLPVTLVYLEQFATIEQAYQREKQIQGWSRAKKEALINDRAYLLPELSRKRQI